MLCLYKYYYLFFVFLTVYNFRDIYCLQVNKYLEQRPCAKQDPIKIKEYLIKLKHMPINLTKKEKLMLVNDPPDSVLQLSLV